MHSTRLLKLLWDGFILLAGFWCGAALRADDSANWPHWRGPNDNGSAAEGKYPVRWDAANVLWKAALPGKGCSTPVVWNRRIFLTAPVDGQDAVSAFDWQGRKRWQTTLSPEHPAKQQRFSSGCNPSPITDGISVFVYFNSGTLAALDLEGRVRWRTNIVATFGPEVLYWDRGTSPVLTAKAVIIARMHHGESWLAAFDKRSGHLIWKVPRNYKTPEEMDNVYTTPLVIQEKGREIVVAWGADHVTAHDAADGRLVWSCGGFNPQATPHYPPAASPVRAGELLIVPCHGAMLGPVAIRLGGAGDVTATHKVWSRTKTPASLPTPSAYKGRLYILGDRGELQCLDAATGKCYWQGTLPKGASGYYASPLIAGGKLYAAREDGVVFVAALLKDKFQLLAANRMREQLIASPVVVSNRLFIRGEHHLFCIADK